MSESYPTEVASVQEGLEKLSQQECLVSLDELMSRRPPYATRDLRHMILVWRRDRTAWGDARDARAAKKEEAEE